MKHRRNQLFCVFLFLLLAGTAQASLTTYTFSFQPEVGGAALPVAASLGQITTYMASILPGTSVDSPAGHDAKDPGYATIYSSTSGANPLPWLGQGGPYLADASGGKHEFSIAFSPNTPIMSASFNWETLNDNLHLDAIYANDGRVNNIYPFPTGNSSEHGTALISFDKPVVELIFRDGDNTGGAIGISNFVASVVPLPSSILLGAFAVGLVGRKLRQFV